MRKEIRDKLVGTYPEVLGRASIGCGDGWAGILGELAGRMRGTGVRIDRVGEKYAALDISVVHDGVRTSILMEVWRAIDEAERLSEETCEECGAPGRRRDGRDGERFDAEVGGWNKTLCDACVLAGDVLEV